MNLFQENDWCCKDCDMCFPAYGPQYECIGCGSENVEIAEWQEEEEEE